MVNDAAYNIRNGSEAIGNANPALASIATPGAVIVASTEVTIIASTGETRALRVEQAASSLSHAATASASKQEGEI